MKVIPAIDLKDGQCVRLLQGNFDKQTVYSADPSGVAKQFSDLAVDDLHVVDLDGARSGKQDNIDLVAQIAAQSGLAVQVGGGIRTREDVVKWLESGASRCVVGSTAINHPNVVCAWMDEFGVDAIVLALDVRLGNDGIPSLLTDGWTRSAGTSLWDCLDAYTRFQSPHVLCTDIARDGALSGPNLDLYAEVLDRYPDLRLQASGGIRNVNDLRALQSLGVPAAISGRALLDGAISASEVASFRPNA
jgi:phosphoribosylformimino-5-aminoimidazole carboxamide ribotide isomerase